MTDRELLEFAAKAAGIEIQFDWEAGRPHCMQGKENPVEWDPLSNDGDALRLAMKLKISLDLYQDQVEAMDSCTPFRIGNDTFYNNFVCIEDGKPSYEASVRRAIVRAAAEIGKEMP